MIWAFWIWVRFVRAEGKTGGNRGGKTGSGKTKTRKTKNRQKPGRQKPGQPDLALLPSLEIEPACSVPFFSSNQCIIKLLCICHIAGSSPSPLKEKSSFESPFHSSQFQNPRPGRSIQKFIKTPKCRKFSNTQKPLNLGSALRPLFQLFLPP